MNSYDFPALYLSADAASASAQNKYLGLILAQYSLLVLAAVCSLWFSQSSDVYVAYAIIVLASTALLIYTSVLKPEKDWYACRALAESIKTSTWRYMMRAEPFDASHTVSEVKKKFADFLKQILSANAHIQEPISKRPRTGEQITKAMDKARSLSLDDRIDMYRKWRVDNQRSWYASRTKSNRSSFQFWVTVCVLAQGLAIILALLRIKHDGALNVWPTEPLLVFASSVIGWIQIKKFNELATAYSLTSHEIGIALARLDDVRSEKDFSDFVNDTERAFSREHTQWVARLTE
ncbi:DUF4231 domain-containing protein [Mesorhizobium sp. CA4]|uniref:DUF4231 domain-containing protein n=1 Tax=Mesorhizobium sp. CA4 TaxID=588499 RepID=UPI001CD0B643|nr:DUF4231 domain-containing protein [Mesorhizobium sp. CA4]MBZ9822375.1 DUF4231 domain-containing protein [Mesorhizobium sp. CA4]